jgi:hypothetical protein
MITASGNNDHMSFTFLFSLYVIPSAPYRRRSRIVFSGVVSTFFLWMVDVDKSRFEYREFILAEEKRKASRKNELGPVSPAAT